MTDKSVWVASLGPEILGVFKYRYLACHKLFEYLCENGYIFLNGTKEEIIIARASIMGETMASYSMLKHYISDIPLARIEKRIFQYNYTLGNQASQNHVESSLPLTEINMIDNVNKRRVEMGMPPLEYQRR